MQQKIGIPLSLILAFLTLRMGLDAILWSHLSPYASYAFEFSFVALTGWYYRKRIHFFNFHWTHLFSDFILPLGAGFGIYKLAVFSLLPIPFDLKSSELIFLLLFVGPLLEELIFRMALWEIIQDLIPKKAFVLILTTLLFSFGHLQSLWAVPAELRAFVLYQSLYVILLGLGAGWRRLESKSLLAPMLIHCTFNLGFFLGSL